uniref:Uncharacterized protein n=1 Tax=Arundo donax TaxID=35708 RepID=A0A0A9C144_ARUDO
MKHKEQLNILHFLPRQ